MQRFVAAGREVLSGRKDLQCSRSVDSLMKLPSPFSGHHLLNRRGFLGHTGTGLSSIALSMMLAEQGLLKADDSALGTISGKIPIRPEINPTHPFATRSSHFPAS